MRAALIDKPLSIKFTDVAEPELKKTNEVKIKVSVTGICGSEIHAYHGTHPFRIPPLVSGHELAGTVIEVGSDVTDVQIGDRVTVEPHYGCGKCSHCLEGRYNVCPNKSVLGASGWTGSFGEYIVVPEQTVVKLPENVSLEEGTLVEPIAVGMHAVRSSELKIGDTVCIIGCGPIGLGALICAKLAGASKIIVSDAADYNLEVAKKLGATYTINPKNENLRDFVEEITCGQGVDVTYLGFANGLIMEDAFAITARGGTIAEIAVMNQQVPINIAPMQLKEIKLLGCNMYCRKDFEIVLEAMSNGKIETDILITDVFPIEDVREAIEMVDKRTKNIVKVMLKF